MYILFKTQPQAPVPQVRVLPCLLSCGTFPVWSHYRGPRPAKLPTQSIVATVWSYVFSHKKMKVGGRPSPP